MNKYLFYKKKTCTGFINKKIAFVLLIKKTLFTAIKTTKSCLIRCMTPI